MTERTQPSKETRGAEETEARKAASADREPTPDEEAAAPSQLDPEVTRHEEEMQEKGVNQQGEGRIA